MITLQNKQQLKNPNFTSDILENVILFQDLQLQCHSLMSGDDVTAVSADRLWLR